MLQKIIVLLIIIWWISLFISQQWQKWWDIKTSNKTNILLIIADDIWFDAMPGYTQWEVKPYLPNIQAMVSAGVSYTNLWSAPVCTPTRASIMTGKYGYHTNMLAVGDELDTNEIGLQEYIDMQTHNSYAHAVIWKWHIWDTVGHPEATWVDYYAGMQSGWTKSYYNWKLTEDKKTSTSKEYITSKFTDLAIDWIWDQDKPWFLWLAYTAPHTPFHLPPEDLHYQWDLANDEESISKNPLPYYMAAIEAMDSEIGRLLENIPKEELENTTIIFIGDNGTPWQVAQFPYSKQQAKWSLYQWGINVPMIISWYGVERLWKVDDILVNTTDLYATISHIAGSDISHIHNSYSFSDSFISENISHREYIYSELWDSKNAGYTVRDERYKIIVLESGKTLMFDLESDPYEQDNLLSRGLSSDEIIVRKKLEEYISQIRN